jgi:hypothetical protein
MISEVVAYAAATAQGTKHWRYCDGPSAGQMTAQGIPQFYSGTGSLSERGTVSKNISRNCLIPNQCGF